MKDIKFRAWDNTNKRMSAVAGLHFFNGGIDINVFADEDEWAEEPDLILMQYTGLKDKNGKEIYDGDIVNFKSYRKTANIGEVVYIDSLASFAVKYWLVLDYLHELFSVHLYKDSLEVIGNIYENSELVNG